jgi:hypothetical protein
MFTQKGELTSSSWLDWKKGKKQPVRWKAPQIKKEELFTLGDDADGRNEGNDDDYGWEP